MDSLDEMPGTEQRYRPVSDFSQPPTFSFTGATVNLQAPAIQALEPILP